MDHDTLRHVLNVLRRGTLTWKGRADCLRRFREARVVRTGANGQPVSKFFWQCQDCKEWFRDQKELEVDHIDEVGPFTGNFNEYIKRMYCEANNLTALCIACHQRKTNKFSSARAKWKRK